MHEFDSVLAKSEELRNISKLIDKTNRELKQDYKREHRYNLNMYEEQLYKEVLFDTRENAVMLDQFNHFNPLKRAKKTASVINIHELS
jgi:hypothetical protein